MMIVYYKHYSANACWNNVIRRLFGYHKWESVSTVLLGLGRLNIRHLIQLRKATFYRHLLQSSDVGLLRHNMFLVYLLNNYDDDCVLQTLFCSNSDAIKTAFENYVLCYACLYCKCECFLSTLYNLYFCLSCCFFAEYRYSLYRRTTSTPEWLK